MPHSILAPVVIFAYKRPNHIRKCLDSLSDNLDAKDTVVFICLDGPKPGDEKHVEEVRHTILEIVEKKLFKDTILLISDVNTNAIFSINCRKDILSHYKVLISLEDDVIVSKNFLKYMNHCLKKYNNRRDIFAISAYMPIFTSDIITENDIFLSKKFTNYGFAVWDHSGYAQALDLNKNAYSLLLKDFRLYIKLLLRFPKVASFSLRQMFFDNTGHMIRGDALLCLYMTIHDKFCIFPAMTMSSNIGFDGSGTHAPKSNKYHFKLTDFDPKIENLQYSRTFDQLLFKHYDGRRSNLSYIRALFLYFYDRFRFYF